MSVKPATLRKRKLTERKFRAELRQVIPAALADARSMDMLMPRPTQGWRRSDEIVQATESFDPFMGENIRSAQVNRIVLVCDELVEEGALETREHEGWRWWRWPLRRGDG